MSFRICPTLFLTVLSLGLLVQTTTLPAGEKTADSQTRSLTVGDLKLTVPGQWKQVKPASRFRIAQFQIPAADGEKDPVDYVVYYFEGGGGGVGANVRRWIGQFEAQGRRVKVTEGKSPQGPYIVVDITGTYKKPIGPPIRMMTQRLPNARMLAVIVGVQEKRKVYYIKVAGGAKTVTAHAKAIRASFGGNAAKEKTLQPQKKEDN